MPICKSTEIENFSVRPSTFITSMASNKNDPKSERKNSFQQKLFLKFLIEITILVAWHLVKFVLFFTVNIFR